MLYIYGRRTPRTKCSLSYLSEFIMAKNKLQHSLIYEINHIDKDDARKLNY